MTAVWLYVCTVLVGLVAGGLAFMAIAVSTATPTLSSGVFVQVHQALYRMADPIMPIFVCGSLFATLPLAVVLFHDGAVNDAGWILAATVGTALVIVITELVNKPINRTVSRWDAANPPTTWARERSRFNQFHAWRTIVAGFSFAIVAGVGIAGTAPSNSERAWALVSVLVSGLVAGGMAFMYVVVGRAMLTLDAPTYTATHQATSLTATRYMTPLTLTSVLSTAAVFVVLWRDGLTTSALLAGGSVVASLAVIIMSVSVNVPLNRRIAQWDSTAPPREWAEVRSRWMRVHRLRASVAMLAFLLLSGSFLTSI